MATADFSEEGGEGYFASVSDLMVGILFVFLLMLTVFALNFRDAEDDQKVAKAELVAAQAAAEAAKVEAQTERARAEAERKTAEQAQAEAARQQAEAQAARMVAEQERQTAALERERAAQAATEAQRQEALAVAARRDAETERENAKLERARAEQARLEAEALRRQQLEAKAEALRQQKLALAAQEEARREKQSAEEQRARNERLRDLLRRAVAQMTADLEQRQNARRRLLSMLEERLRKDGVVISVDPESGVLRLPEQLLFASGSSKLEAQATVTLETLARSLGDVLPCFARSDTGSGCSERDASVLEGVLVEGHSDQQRFRGSGGTMLSAEASRELNDRLATGRALSVFKELLKRDGLDALQNSAGLPLFAVSAYGDRRPAVQGSDAAAYGKNRRIDLRFLLSSRTSDELQRLLEEIRPALEEGRS